MDVTRTTVLADLGDYRQVADGLAIVNEGGESVSGPVRGGRWGWRRDGELVSRAEWKDVIGLCAGIGVVSLGAKKGLRVVDLDGNTLQELDGDWGMPTVQGMVLVRRAAAG